MKNLQPKYPSHGSAKSGFFGTKVLSRFGASSKYWQGKTAVVCGGSSGLGLSIAEELVRQDIGHLILIARNPDQLCTSAETLTSLAAGHTLPREGKITFKPELTRITTIVADLIDESSVQSAAREIAKASTQVDLLIQAVGCSDRGLIAGLTRQRLMELVDANVVTSLHAIQHLSPLLRSSRGVIVLIGSLSSFFAPRFLGGYSIAKHGLAALAQQARLELADHGVHVTLCCPGPIARSDSGSRYSGSSRASEIPLEAQLPGGGAKVKGLVPERLSRDILTSAWQREYLLILPRKAWWLRLVSAISSKIGERILRSQSS